jgi:hypothetical protein
MPFVAISILSIAIQVGMIVHCVRTGRSTLWIWILIMGSLVGVLAYVAVEILPDIGKGRAARRAVSGLKRTIDPSRDLRNAQRQLRTTDSIDSRRRLAEELLGKGRYDEAIEHFRAGLTGLYEHEPLLMFGIARAQFEQGNVTGARQTLDDLIEHNPDFKSPDAHLLYARALEKEGNVTKACEEYEVLSRYYPGVEARYRHALCLRQAGKGEEARGMLIKLLDDAELSTRHARRLQKEWIGAAKKALNQQ